MLSTVNNISYTSWDETKNGVHMNGSWLFLITLVTLGEMRLNMVFRLVYAGYC